LRQLVLDHFRGAAELAFTICVLTTAAELASLDQKPHAVLPHTSSWCLCPSPGLSARLSGLWDSTLWIESSWDMYFNVQWCLYNSSNPSPRLSARLGGLWDSTL